MSDVQITKDATSQFVELVILDATTGLAELGVLWNETGIDLNYRRDGAVVTSITEKALTTPALTDAYDSGGFLEVANGRYRLDVPDAAFATGVDKVTIGGTITGMIVIPVVVQLIDAPALATSLAVLTDAFVLTSATIEAVTSQTDFTLPATADAVDDQAYHGALAVFIDGTDPNQKSFRIIETYTASTRRFTVSKAPDFTVTTSDIVTILATTDAGGVWDMLLTGSKHNLATSAGRRLRQLSGITQTEGTISDASPADNGFDTDLTEADGFWRDTLIIFQDGALAGQPRIVETFLNTNGAMTFDEVWTSAPANGDAFLMLSTHTHSLAAIVNSLLDEALSGHTTAGTLGKAVVDIEADLDNATDGLGALKTLIDALNDISLAGVANEISDAWTVDTMAELADALPAVTPTRAIALMSVYMDWRNKTLATATLKTMHKADGTAIIKWVLADAAGTSSKANAQAQT